VIAKNYEEARDECAQVKGLYLAASKRRIFHGNSQNDIEELTPISPISTGVLRISWMARFPLTIQKKRANLRVSRA